jgi:hypothetical protein
VAVALDCSWFYMSDYMTDKSMEGVWMCALANLINSFTILLLDTVIIAKCMAKKNLNVFKIV